MLDPSELHLLQTLISNRIESVEACLTSTKPPCACTPSCLFEMTVLLGLQQTIADSIEPTQNQY